MYFYLYFFIAKSIKSVFYAFFIIATNSLEWVKTEIILMPADAKNKWFKTFVWTTDINYFWSPHSKYDVSRKKLIL